MRALKPSKAAERFIEGLPAKQFRQVWLKILALTAQPYPPDSAKLAGYPYHRVDAGEYRIIYQATPEVVEIVLAGKRNDDAVYRQLRRKG